MGLEVSRLARNCADWHRLLEICALSHTLILDEDGFYDPAHYNDRLLLGLKGTMSEAELHVLKARLVGGVLNKAQRGELKMPLPVGLVYDEENKVILDPDQQVQQSLRVFFATFERAGSAWATVQAFRRDGLKFPKRGQAGSGEIAWQELTHAITLDTLHNPRYAGAFCFGRTRSWTDAQGKYHCRQLPREQWRFLKQNAHAGYLTWEQYLGNQERLLQNHQAHGGGERKAGPPREGPALLQGLALCGKCGRGEHARWCRDVRLQGLPRARGDLEQLQVHVRDDGLVHAEPDEPARQQLDRGQQQRDELQLQYECQSVHDLRLPHQFRRWSTRPVPVRPRRRPRCTARTCRRHSPTLSQRPPTGLCSAGSATPPVRPRATTRTARSARTTSRFRPRTAPRSRCLL